jgi:dienelactone hydrolase
MWGDRRSARRVLAVATAMLACAIGAAGAAGFDPDKESQNFDKTSEREQYITKTPEFQTLLAEKEVDNDLENTEIQTSDPERDPYGNVCWNRNRECAGDVRFYDWAKQTHNIQEPVLFTARSGATISGNVWATKKGPRKRPAVVITTGSVQAPETLYWGTAAMLASHGYVVLTYDVQGQGRSDTFGVGPDEQEGVPSQEGQPFFDDTEDALDFLLSSKRDPYVPRKSCGNANGGVGTSHADKQRRRVREGFNAKFDPLRRMIDVKRIGIAGHSLGAGAVSYIGQLDPRVKAIVAWDNLSDVSKSGGSMFGAPDCPSGSSLRPKKVKLTKPAMGFSNDYGLVATPNEDDPDPQSHNDGFKGYRRAKVDSMQVNTRGGTHYEYSFIPGQTVPNLGLATYRGMDMQSWYSRAWLDRYVKCRGSKSCKRHADRRLLTDRWRDDKLEKVVDNHGDGNLYSFYLRSRYAFTTARGKRVRCPDMRRGCRRMKPDGVRPKSYLQTEDAYRSSDEPPPGPPPPGQ